MVNPFWKLFGDVAKKTPNFKYCTVYEIAVSLQRDFDHTAKSGGTSAKSELSALGLHWHVDMHNNTEEIHKEYLFS